VQIPKLENKMEEMKYEMEEMNKKSKLQEEEILKLKKENADQ
jgi:hypothetical protein